jgi:microcompartment protein CcmK/EutM
MRYCRVVAPMWATVKHPAFAGRALFVVQPLDERGGDAGAAVERRHRRVLDRLGHRRALVRGQRARVDRRQRAVLRLGDRLGRLRRQLAPGEVVVDGRGELPGHHRAEGGDGEQRGDQRGLDQAGKRRRAANGGGHGTHDPSG